MLSENNKKARVARYTHYFYWLIFAGFLAVMAVLAYGNQVMYHYAVPPGYDAIPHSNVIDAIIGGDIPQIFGYHTVWHLLMIPFVLIMPGPTISNVAWLAPALQLTTVLSLFWVAYKWFGKVAALAVITLIGFFSLQPWQTLGDGGYPNVLAAGTVLPLCALFATYITSRKWRWWFLPVIVACLIVLLYTHHLTTLYALPIFFIYGLIMIARALIQRGINAFLLLAIFGLLAVGGLMGGWYFLHFPNTLSVTQLAHDFIRADTVFPFFHLIGKLGDPSAILPVDLYTQDIGYVLIYVGIIGTVIAAIDVLFTPKNPRWNIYVLLLIWAAVLYVGSRVESLGYPVRLARDLAIPLAFLGAAAFSDLYEALHKSIVGLAAIGIIILMLLVIGKPTLRMRYHIMADPNAQVHHLDVDTQAANYITNNLPTDAKILLLQEDLYAEMFTPKHTITWIFTSNIQDPILTFNHPEEVLKKWDYFYFEEQHDIPPTALNNPELTAYYTKSNPFVEAVASFKQPEKDVYILKINHEAIQASVNP